MKKTLERASSDVIHKSTLQPRGNKSLLRYKGLFQQQRAFSAYCSTKTDRMNNLF